MEGISPLQPPTTDGRQHPPTPGGDTHLQWHQCLVCPFTFLKSDMENLTDLISTEFHQAKWVHWIQFGQAKKNLPDGKVGVNCKFSHSCFLMVIFVYLKHSAIVCQSDPFHRSVVVLKLQGSKVHQRCCAPECLLPPASCLLPPDCYLGRAIGDCSLPD